MVAKVRLVVLAVGTLLLLTSTASAQHRDTFPGNDSLDQQLAAVLLGAQFTGRIESTLEARLDVASTRSWPMWGACCGLTQSPD